MARDPIFGVNSVVRELQRSRARQEQTRENASRQAWSYARYHTSGSGEIQLTGVTPFDTVFIEQPQVHTGFSVVSPDLIPGRFPHVTAGVYRWQTDTRGFYVGAYVYFVIDTQGPDTDPRQVYTDFEHPPVYTLEHFFQFVGTAIKDVPGYLLDY